jgi:hypothetical protein
MTSPATPSRGAAGLVESWGTPIALAVSAPFYYRRLTRTGPLKPHPLRLSVLTVVATAAESLLQRQVVRDARPVEPSERPAWHDADALPVWVTDVENAAPAALGRTSDGPVVVLRADLLRDGTPEQQAAAYRDEARFERGTRLGVSLAFSAVSVATDEAVDRLMLGDRTNPVPLSRGRALTYLAVSGARALLVAEAYRRIRRPTS